MKAVILAAGCATRLRPYSDDTPKTLLPVGGVPILRRTITNLLRVGFDQFVIGTGYLEHMVREAVGTWFPGLDVSYVEELVDRGPDCLAVRSVGEIGLEEVKVTADNQDRVLAIGKHVPVRSAMGESVGIELFSAASSKRLFVALHQRVLEQGLVDEYYEAAFQQILDDGTTLYGVDIGSMYASEIDTVEDL